MKRLKYKVGQKVILKENKEEGWPRENAKILEISDDGETAIVEVKPHDEDDDGIREITLDQIE